MRATRAGLIGSVLLATVTAAGCEYAGSAQPAGGSPSVGQQATTAPSGPAGADPACATISASIKAAVAKVGEAEKIGPPAGHSAVSAEYSAGAATLYADMIPATAPVGEAAKQVATAMSDLADTYATDPAKKPSKKALNAAIERFEAACDTAG